MANHKSTKRDREHNSNLRSAWIGILTKEGYVIPEVINNPYSIKDESPYKS